MGWVYHLRDVRSDLGTPRAAQRPGHHPLGLGIALFGQFSGSEFIYFQF